MTSSRLRSLWLLATLSLLAAACADSAPGKGSGADMGAGGDNSIPVGGTPATAPPTAPPSATGEPTLQVLGEAELTVDYGSRLDIQVRYYDGNAAPSPNATVRASMVDTATGADVTAAGVGGTILDASTGTTDASGTAVFTVSSGGTAADFYVKFTADGVAPDPADQVHVVVQRAGTGSLTVKGIYVPAGRMGGGRYRFADDEINGARMFLFAQDCDSLLQARGPSNLPQADYALNSGRPISPFNAVSNRATQPELLDGATYAAAVQAINAAGNVLAFGCVSGVTVVGGTDTSVDVPLTDLPLEYKGEYQVVHRFDLTDMLTNSGIPALGIVDQVLEWIGIIGNSNGDRGEAIIDAICDLVGAEGTIQSICDALGVVGGRIVDNLIEEYIPCEVLNVFNIVGDVYSIVSDLTVVGTLVLNPVEMDPYALQADNRWQEFQFTWRNGCMVAGEDGEQRLCGDIPLPADPRDCIRQFPIGPDGEERPIAGLFEAAVCDLSAAAEARPATCPASLEITQLIIPSHSFNAHYGTILLAVAEQWIIPAVLGATSGNPVDGPVALDELLGQLLPCETINNAIGAGSSFCENVLVAAISDLVVDQLSRLDINIAPFTVSGTVNPKDTNADLNIDRLDDGVWTGVIDFGGNMVPFRGCFSGCKKEFDENRRVIPCPDVETPCTIVDAQ